MKMFEIGYNHRHDRSFCIDRPDGSDSWLMLIVKTPAHFRIGGKDVRTSAHSFIIYRPDTPQYYYPASNEYFDDWMHFPFEDDFFGKKNPLYGKHAKNLMKTDVRETDNSYELDIDLPGFKKDEVKLQLKDGYLTVNAAKGLDKDEKDKNGKYIRQERYAGAMSRSFYVGTDVQTDEIHAKFEDGILKLSVPKKDPKAVEDRTYISIEG